MIVVRKSQIKEMEKQRKRSNMNMLAAGILIGALIGAVVALLMAPQDGGQTRGQLLGSARKLSDKCKGLFGGCCCCGEDCECEEGCCEENCCETEE